MQATKPVRPSAFHFAKLEHTIMRLAAQRRGPNANANRVRASGTATRIRPTWGQLNTAVPARMGTQPEVVQRNAQLLLTHAWRESISYSRISDATTA